MCDDSRTVSRWFGEGDTVFPQGIYQQALFLTASAEAVKHELDAPSNGAISGSKSQLVVSGADEEFTKGLASAMAKMNGNQSSPTFSVSGCLDYETDCSGKRRQTMFLYELKGVDFRTDNTQGAILIKNYGWGNTAH